MDLPQTFLSLGIALGVGLLIGIQRERVHSRRAGARTFPLIALLGGVCALLSGSLGVWVVVGGFLGVIAAFVVSNVSTMREPEQDVGTTTEIAMLVTFALGALAVLGSHEVVLVVGGVVLVLLHVKEPLHSLVARLGEKDVRAIVQFALIALVVLPVLPDRTFGPYGVFNPHKTWIVVVLVVAIGLAAYVARKLFGERRGAIIGGVLGGLISSTATTASISRQAKGSPDVRLHVLIVTIASAMVFPRQLVEVVAIAPAQFASVGPPLAIAFAAFLPPVLWTWRAAVTQDVEFPEPKNPSELGPAIAFGAMFAIVLFAVAIAEDQFGSRGLYAVAGLAGLTDVDAITLSTARLAGDGRIAAATAWRAVLLASLVNLAFKLGISGVLGGRKMLRVTALAFAPVFAVGGLLLAVW